MQALHKALEEKTIPANEKDIQKILPEELLEKFNQKAPKEM
jgi:hypothetical protein